MTVDEIEFTELQAVLFVLHPETWNIFLNDNGIASTPALANKLYEKFEAADDEVYRQYERLIHGDKPSAWRGWRPDALALCRYVDSNPPMTMRMRQVFELCVREGLSLGACAERLRIGRESVRTQLRRLRAQARRFGALDDVGPLAWEALPNGCRKGYAPRPLQSGQGDPPGAPQQMVPQVSGPTGPPAAQMLPPVQRGPEPQWHVAVAVSHDSPLPQQPLPHATPMPPQVGEPMHEGAGPASFTVEEPPSDAPITLPSVDVSDDASIIEPGGASIMDPGGASM